MSNKGSVALTAFGSATAPTNTAHKPGKKVRFCQARELMIKNAMHSNYMEFPSYDQLKNGNKMLHKGKIKRSLLKFDNKNYA